MKNQKTTLSKGTAEECTLSKRNNQRRGDYVIRKEAQGILRKTVKRIPWLTAMWEVQRTEGSREIFPWTTKQK